MIFPLCTQKDNQSRVDSYNQMPGGYSVSPFQLHRKRKQGRKCNSVYKIKLNIVDHGKKIKTRKIIAESLGIFHDLYDRGIIIYMTEEKQWAFLSEK